MKKILVFILFIVLLVMAFFIYRNQTMLQTQNGTNRNNTETGSIETETTNTQPISCSGKAIPTQTEGPYYTANSPETNNLYQSTIPGEKVTVTGYVVDTNCQPIAHAWIDFWQANGEGNYDNEGYTLRGHQYTDAEGKFTLQTVIPGEYPGRTPHIHFKVQANENAQIITSQLYLPDAEKNTSDAIFDEALVMDITDTADGKVATYNIVINR